jgi:hypothetical protein
MLKENLKQYLSELLGAELLPKEGVDYTITVDDTEGKLNVVIKAKTVLGRSYLAPLNEVIDNKIKRYETTVKEQNGR